MTLHYSLLFSSATPLSGRPLSVLGVNCRHVLLYNLGLQQLFAGHPLAAFDSLLEVVQVYHANPRLWLRLAEACIAVHIKVCIICRLRSPGTTSLHCRPPNKKLLLIIRARLYGQ